MSTSSAAVGAKAPRFMDDDRRATLCDAFESRIGMIREISMGILQE